MRIGGAASAGLVYAKAFLCLVFERAFLDDIVEWDLRKELHRNEQLASPDQARREQKRADLKTLTRHRLRLPRSKSLWSLLWIVAALLASWCVARPALTLPLLCATLSVVIFAWATLGRLGWAGQSIKGDTV